MDKITRTIQPLPFDLCINDGTVVGLANHTLLIRQDGKEIAFEDSMAPICHEKGKIDCSSGLS